MRYYPLVAYYPLVEIMVCAFNVVLFALLSFYCIRDYRRQKTEWGGYIYAYLVVVCGLLFVAHLANDFAAEFVWHRYRIFDFFEITAKYLIPPLVLHLFFRNEEQHLQRLALWRISVGVLYTMAAAFALPEMNIGVFGWFHAWPGWRVARPLFRALMTVAAVSSGLVLWTAHPRNASLLYQRRRRWLIYVCGAWAAVFAFGEFLPERIDSILTKVIPLCFVYVITYYVERFTFFDIVIKKGTFVFASLFLFALYFVTAPPLIAKLGLHTWVGTLVWSLSLWPIALLAPWGHRALSSWVDHHFLGRRFSPAQATKYFLSGLQGVIDERELAHQAAAHLTTIFGSQARVFLDPHSRPVRASNDGSMTVMIRLNGVSVGVIRVEERERHARFMSEDLALLASLADGLAFLIENLRMREKRLHQEQREQELLLNANRSELKALRAQINPHFLFNALNTIAALIPRHPDRAEETVEELAEVFRYTLRRSEREWVQLEEELEAVRSYLHIEQARFGQSLRFQIAATGDTRNIRIPAMAIQTLVENSVKHGVASLGKPGVVEVRIDIGESDLQVEVRDNGRGFDRSSISKLPSSGNGYGLRNVEERLRGYFGDAAKLTIGRDREREMTVVSIQMPTTGPTVGASMG